jgi:hypothetical protein
MNLNKYTKAELISKFKKLEVKNSSNSKDITIWNKIVESILLLKGLIIKITIISLLIKIFKKYTFITKILRFANWIILSIFGISMIDNFEISFITNFFKEIKMITYSIVSYFSGTHFYSFISSLFSTKEDISNQGKISIREKPIYSEHSKIESKISESKGSSKISEWLKPEKEEIKEEESSNTKYYIIAGIIIFACLAWYYSDEIRPGTESLFEWFRSFRPTSGDSPTNITADNRVNNTMNLKSRIKNSLVEMRIQNWLL